MYVFTPATPVAEAHWLQAPVPVADPETPVALLETEFQSAQAVEQTADGVTTEVAQTGPTIPVDIACQATVSR